MKLNDTTTPVTSLKPNSSEVTPVITNKKKKVENLKISIPPPKDKPQPLPKTPANNANFNKT